jgi:hypothetical protein
VKIPEVANRMREISEDIEGSFPAAARELRQLADELRRRSPTLPRAPATSTPMTPELADEIREFAEANPGTSHQDIAVVFNVNHGRISEVLSGKRE